MSPAQLLVQRRVAASAVIQRHVRGERLGTDDAAEVPHVARIPPIDQRRERFQPVRKVVGRSGRADVRRLIEKAVQVRTARPVEALLVERVRHRSLQGHRQVGFKRRMHGQILDAEFDLTREPLRAAAHERVGARR